MGAVDDLLGGFETHSIGEIRRALEDGADPNAPIRGRAPIDWLIEIYMRSERFAECIRVMLAAGAELSDSYLRALLLDEPDLLHEVLRANPGDIERRFSLGCAYTSLRGASGLHVCAEYNSVKCARALLDLGLDVDVRAEFDGDGLGGQTPLFHTVNSNRNYCRPMMELLAGSEASLDIRLKGLLWGSGCEWETVLFDVSPISYAQCGLYPQFHRLEEHIYGNIGFLYRVRYGDGAPLRNFPNKYVKRDFNLGAARRGQLPERSKSLGD